MNKPSQTAPVSLDTGAVVVMAMDRREGCGGGGVDSSIQCPAGFPVGSSRPAALNAPWMFTWQARPVFSM